MEEKQESYAQIKWMEYNKEHDEKESKLPAPHEAAGFVARA